MNAKYLIAAGLVVLTAVAAATPASLAAGKKAVKHSATAHKAAAAKGKFGPITPNDLQGTYQAHKSWNFMTNKWEGPAKAYIALTKVGPGSYKFPGFDDVFKGDSKSCS